MRKNRPFVRPASALALALGCLLANASAQAADHARATLMVTATVQRHTSMRMALPATLTITAGDLARGYIELPAPVEVSVQSNVQDGYTLLFERAGTQVRAARIQGIGGPVVIGSGSALAARPATGQGMWRDVLQLRFRFELDAAATVGEHPWPVQVSMMSN
jgi:hypothetical protein